MVLLKEEGVVGSNGLPYYEMGVEPLGVVFIGVLFSLRDLLAETFGILAAGG